MSSIIYKISPRAEWLAALAAGRFDGAPVDLADGFIHFSTAAQVADTAAKHFAGKTDLIIAAIAAESLGSALTWEPSRGGVLFPHLYGPLEARHVLWTRPLPWDPGLARHVLPDIDPARQASRAEQAVLDLHVFFEAWLSGRAPHGPGALATLEAALAEGFSMVGPQGRRLDRAEVVGWIETSHGTRGTDFCIWITDMSQLFEAPGVVAIGYVENQRMDGRDTARHATALFSVTPGAVVWRAVHETWKAE